MKVYQSLITAVRFAQSSADTKARDKDNLDFLLQAYPLKEVKRAWCVNRKIKPGETVASHTWGASLLALILAPKEIDINKVLKLLTVHDLAEVKVGDITPDDKVPTDEKQKLERSAVNFIAPKNPEIKALWEEYNAKKTPEAQFASQLDKLDILVQSIVYKARGYNVKDIFDKVMGLIKDPRLKGFAEQIKERFSKTKNQPR